MIRFTFFIVIVLVLGMSTGIIFADTMTSGTYRIESDSINFGGGLSTSTSYSQESTFGEVATGNGSSPSFNLYAGYQQMHEVYLAVSAAPNVVMSPSIGGVTGGTANGSTDITVTTDNFAGYQLLIKASSSPALVSGSNSFADYTPAGSDPDFGFSINSTDSEFGFSPEGVDIDTRYKDNGSSCNSGSSDTADSCWDALSTTNRVISNRTSQNIPSGTQTVLKFRVQSGASHLQPQGTYIATTTLTAIPL